MSRSLKKGIYIDKKLSKKIQKALETGNKAPIKTWARNSTVVPDMVGLTFGIHNGKTHIEVLITESMVGHKLGEFSPTRKFRGHSSKKL